MHVHPFGIAAAAAVIAGSAAAAPIDAFDAFFVLGDSLSDVGNVYAQTSQTLPDPDTYFEGRWTNGFNWVDYVADDAFPTSLVLSYAYGNGRAIANGDPFLDLPDQADGVVNFLDPADRGANPLVALWFGANDIFGSVGGGDAVAVARDAAEAIGDAAIAIGDAGFRNIMMFNLPNLGLTPRYFFGMSGDRAEATAATSAFNEALSVQADRVRGAGFGVTQIDVESLFADLTGGLDALELVGFLLPCVINDPSDFSVISECDDVGDRLFFDAVHPTTTGHRLIADAVLAADFELAPMPVPLPAGLTLMLGALGLLGAVGVARRS